MRNVLGWVLHNNPRPSLFFLLAGPFLFLTILLLHFGFGQYLAATLSVSISSGEESGTNNKLTTVRRPWCPTATMDWPSSPNCSSSSLRQRRQSTASVPSTLSDSARLIPSFSNRFPEEFLPVLSSDSTGSFYSRRSSRRPSSWPPTASSSSFPCPSCWPVSAKASQGPTQTNGPDRSRDVLLVLFAQQHQQRGQRQCWTFSVASSSPAGPGENQQQTGSSQLPGFQLLGWLLGNHTAKWSTFSSD